MKKTKLIMSIITCCFALSVLAFGVYASLSVNFNLCGKISFDPNGVDATITTQVFKYKEEIDQEQAYLKASELQVEDFDTLVSKGYESLTTKKEYLTKEGNTYNPNLEQDLSESVLNFEDCKAYFIVVHVLPSDSYSLEEHNQIVFVELTQQELPENNVWLAYNDKYLPIYPSAQETGFNMVFFIGITEPYIAVPEKNFSLTLTFDYKDIYVPTQEDYNYSDRDCFYPQQYVEDIVLPEIYNGEILKECYDEGAYLSGKVIISKYIESYGTDFSTTEISVSQDNENYSSLDGSLYNKTKSILCLHENVNETDIINIHSFVEELDFHAFVENNIITTVNLPNGLKKIAEDAFFYCRNLSTITIPDKVTSIGQTAFCGTLLNSIFIPKSVQTMGERVFHDIKNSNFKIYCEIQYEDIPTEWNNEWNKDVHGNDWPVEWGFTRDDYNRIVNS